MHFVHLVFLSQLSFCSTSRLNFNLLSICILISIPQGLFSVTGASEWVYCHYLGCGQKNKSSSLSEFSNPLLALQRRFILPILSNTVLCKTSVIAQFKDTLKIMCSSFPQSILGDCICVFVSFSYWVFIIFHQDNNCTALQV